MCVAGTGGTGRGVAYDRVRGDERGGEMMRGHERG